MSLHFNEKFAKEQVNFYLNFLAKEVRSNSFASYDNEDIKKIKHYFSLFSSIQKNELLYQLLNTNSENIINWHKLLFQEKKENILEVSNSFYNTKISKQFEEENAYCVVNTLFDNPKTNMACLEEIFNYLNWTSELVNYVVNENLVYRSEKLIENIFSYLTEKDLFKQLDENNLKAFVKEYLANKDYPLSVCLNLLFISQVNTHPFNTLDNESKDKIFNDKGFTLSLLVEAIKKCYKNQKELTIFEPLKDLVSEKQFKEAYFDLAHDNRDNRRDFFKLAFNYTLKNRNLIDVKELGEILSFITYYNKIAKQLNFTQLELHIDKDIDKLDNDEKLTLLEKLKLSFSLSIFTSQPKERIKI